ncbi:hypothetical protein IC235_18405 [Hymenobacter sp. BT664]|uniref:Uncharacterized protein n=1 Tax=Hymenobacter montanus TaxID=2771359 RepID=A0A927BFC9_9BACT|nr:hypothetical protein [Hymenobacter montanus]MBD2769866.1 hypothetical protein [Hymenobacter montanus]
MPRNLPVNFDPAAPSISASIRIEPISEDKDLTTTVRANVHDALWMLSQQWRVGEFKGEDAGTLVKAKVETQSTKINRYKGWKSPVEEFNPNIPLEARVERQPLILDLGMQLEIGLMWYKVLKANAVASNYSAYVTRFEIAVPAGGSQLEIQSNRYSMNMRKTARKRIMDGAAFVEYLQAGNAARSVPGLNAADLATIDTAEAAFRAWLSNTYCLPTSLADDSWSNEHLEYRFSVSAPLAAAANASQTVLDADRYTLGDIDWYSVDLNADANFQLTAPASVPINNANAIGASQVLSYLPQHLSWKGMPKGRWWEFEDRNIDISKLSTQKQDISKLILMEFGLIYSNDWFVIPHQLEVGSITEIRNLMVTDVFNQRFLIKRAGAASNNSWQKWDMYQVSKKGQPAHQAGLDKLLLLPSLINKVESEPIEKVMFLRDEMANMIWGVEDVVPNDLFGGQNGKDAANNLLDFLELTYPPVTATTTPNQATLRYKLQNTVPENWIPFVPMASQINPANYRARKVQRARFLRYINEQYVPAPIFPRTNLLRQGLDEETPQTNLRFVIPKPRTSSSMPGPEPYFVNQEEVSKSGHVVSATFQRTRWYDGRPFVWIGRKKQTGRGEANVKYEYDVLKDKEAGT